MLLPAAGMTLSSCKRLTESMEIKETREISSYNTSPKAFSTSAERFYDTQPEEQAPQQNPLAWVTPEGWTDAPPSSGSTMGGMRLIDLRFGPNGEGECFLSAMPGTGGGLEANINRWRTQMEQPAYTADELAKLPKKPFLGREAVFVEFDGAFRNVGETASRDGFRLMGMVQPAPEFTLFVKMTGPKELVEKNAAAFHQFCESISIKR